jgi:hypothetical protein
VCDGVGVGVGGVFPARADFDLGVQGGGFHLFFSGCVCDVCVYFLVGMSVCVYIHTHLYIHPIYIPSLTHLGVHLNKRQFLNKVPPGLHQSKVRGGKAHSTHRIQTIVISKSLTPQLGQFGLEGGFAGVVAVGVCVCVCVLGMGVSVCIYIYICEKRGDMRRQECGRYVCDCVCVCLCRCVIVSSSLMAFYDLACLALELPPHLQPSLFSFTPYHTHTIV